MPRSDVRYCKGCGRSSEEVGELSWTRLCIECGIARFNGNNYEIAAKTGPAYERQRVGMIASALGIPKVMARKLLLAANGAPLDDASPPT